MELGDRPVDAGGRERQRGGEEEGKQAGHTCFMAVARSIY
jgi:hypothetical protein